MASNRSTPNIPRLESVKVPAKGGKATSLRGNTTHVALGIH